MTLVALYPTRVRSAVLDSIYPPDPKPMFSANVGDALDAFFRYCAGDQACASAIATSRGPTARQCRGLLTRR
jgi:hypothetical protein